MIPPAPTGPAKFFYVIGILIGFAGIAIMMVAIGTTVAEGFQSFDTGPTAEPPDFSRIGEWLPVGLALAIPGSILAAISSAIGPHPRSGNDIRVERGVLHTGTGNVNVTDSMNDQTVVNTYFARIAMNELSTIQEVVAALQLPIAVEREIQSYLEEAAWMLRQNQPSADRLGDQLARATRLLRQSGALARAGGELVPRLVHLSSLLGTTGSAILKVLN